ncbi:hypothetical protein QQ045_010123 [Rhodiola kirilowii]
MSNSREDSPDWLRSYQPPNHSVVTLSSDSDSSDRVHSLSAEDLPDLKKPIQSEFSVSTEEGKEISNTLHHNEAQSFIKNNLQSSLKIESSENRVYTKKRKANEKSKGKSAEARSFKKGITHQHVDSHPTEDLARSLSPDSESFLPKSPKMVDTVDNKESSIPKVTRQESDIIPVSRREVSVPKDVSCKKSTENSPMKRLIAGKKSKKEEESISNKGEDPTVGIPEEEVVDLHTEPTVGSTTMPLVLPEKVQRSKVLVECEGDSIDMSGDMGAVGRVMISDAPSGKEMYLDLKGMPFLYFIRYRSCILLFIMIIEAIMNDFIQLKPQSNVFLAETMVEGTLDGFSFDSEDEAERVLKPTAAQNGENDDAEQVNGKGKGKTEKNSGKMQKRGKSAGGKPVKKARKKLQAPKKAKNKK